MADRLIAVSVEVRHQTRGTLGMTEAFRLSTVLLSVACCVFAIAAPCAAADAAHGKDIAKRWCASCHLVESGQTSATDRAPPFSYLATIPEFDQNRLAFLLLLPHPNMPKVSLNQADVADLADYIRSVK
ncbi:c-type cytochrome [Bradyrhizobium sp. SZCCHNPS2010]|uniref:c-type cytochrome n=1 Tax=Bradyrhizobium sp. SZCCHNPS2010 TaxID=3057333 RepID=UPI002916669E|nr:c-type cytochrome [Bradyrhizobium sp. SZCCHNPS2010]